MTPKWISGLLLLSLFFRYASWAAEERQLPCGHELERSEKGPGPSVEGSQVRDLSRSEQAEGEAASLPATLDKSSPNPVFDTADVIRVPLTLQKLGVRTLEELKSIQGRNALARILAVEFISEAERLELEIEPEVFRYCKALIQSPERRIFGPSQDLEQVKLFEDLEERSLYHHGVLNRLYIESTREPNPKPRSFAEATRRKAMTRSEIPAFRYGTAEQFAKELRKVSSSRQLEAFQDSITAIPPLMASEVIALLSVVSSDQQAKVLQLLIDNKKLLLDGDLYPKGVFHAELYSLHPKARELLERSLILFQPEKPALVRRALQRSEIFWERSRYRRYFFWEKFKRQAAIVAVAGTLAGATGGWRVWLHQRHQQMVQGYQIHRLPISEIAIDITNSSNEADRASNYLDVLSKVLTPDDMIVIHQAVKPTYGKDAAALMTRYVEENYGRLTAEQLEKLKPLSDRPTMVDILIQQKKQGIGH